MLLELPLGKRQSWLPVGEGPIEWEEFKNAFLSKCFPCEKREVNIEEHISLRQGNMNSIKFTQLFKYAPITVSYPNMR